MKPMDNLDTQLVIAEYNNLWTERLNRIGVRYQIISFALIALGTILGINNTTLLLLYPVLAFFLLTAYIGNTYQSQKIEEYIRKKIEVRFGKADFGWQHYRGLHKKRGITVDLGFLGGRSVFLVAEIISVVVGLSLKKYNLAVLEEYFPDPYVKTAFLFTFLTLLLVLFRDWVTIWSAKLQEWLNKKTDYKQPLLHIAMREQWEQAKKVGQYKGNTLDSKGYIDFSKPEQVIEDANALFQGQKELVLLYIDDSKVQSEIRYETIGGTLYTFLYDVISTEVVIDEIYFARDTSGKFTLPQGILEKKVKYIRSK